MARKKAAGGDGLVAELFQRLPCFVKPATSLFNVILQNGRMPHQMLRVAMIPLDKPHQGFSGWVATKHEVLLPPALDPEALRPVDTPEQSDSQLALEDTRRGRPSPISPSPAP